MVNGVGFEPTLQQRITRGCDFGPLVHPFISPSLRPPTLSRVVCCLWSTDLYSERPSYRHLCVSPLRLCGSAESDLTITRRLGFPYLTHILYHFRIHLSIVKIHKLSRIFALLFVQIDGVAPGQPIPGNTEHMFDFGFGPSPETPARPPNT